MKKLINYLAIGALVLTTSCNQDHLEVDNLYEKSLDNFYSRPQDIDEALSGVYNAVIAPSNNPFSNEHIVANLLSDMMLGGGGPDDVGAKNTDGFIDPNEDTYRGLWGATYNGALRANAIIEYTPDADFSLYFDTEQQAIDYKNQALGEAYFLRGFLYFRLAKFFGGVPLKTSLEDPLEIPRATLTETYAQIASDFKTAIELMPDTNQFSVPIERYGHANKWIAEAFLARAYLYYTGYMTNIEGQATSTLPLTDGGSLSASDITTYLNDCIANSGYSLTPDFRNLWPYSYVNTSAGAEVLPWAADNSLAWVGQDGPSSAFGTGNNETMFSARYAFGDFPAGTQQFSNMVCLYFGIRDNSLIPFGQGWGWGPVNPNLWSSWDDADPRKEGSILPMGEDVQGTGAYDVTKAGDQHTGFFNKKYIALQHEGGDGKKGMFAYMYGVQNFSDLYQLMHAQDFIMMRYADVLLMHSEISQTADGLNDVRNRVGLGPVGYSLDAIKEERLHEFAFEGLRWFDLVRWGDVDTAFSGSIPVNNSGVSATYSTTYRPETKGLLPVPEQDIRLLNGLWEQNPGW